MTGLAADPVREAELRPALRGRCIVGMTVEADIGVLGVGKTQILRDAPAALLLQYGKRLGVFVLLRPDQVFVLGDARILKAFDRAMAVVAGARGDAEMGRWRALCLGPARDDGQQAKANPRRHCDRVPPEAAHLPRAR